MLTQRRAKRAIASTLASFSLAAVCLLVACATHKPADEREGRGGVAPPANPAGQVAQGRRGRGAARGGTPGEGRGRGRGRGQVPLSPAVQMRTYLFEETGEM